MTLASLQKPSRPRADKKLIDYPATCQLHMSLNLCLLLGCVGANLCR
jgi:hypothetical protein